MVKKVEHMTHSKVKLGTIFFILGAGIALVGGLIYPGGLNLTLSSVLITLGIIVGILNVTVIETNNQYNC